MYKSILVTGLNEALAPATMELAIAAAKPGGAHIESLHVHPGPRELAYYSTSINAESAAFTGQLVDSIITADRKICARSHAVHETVCTRKGLAPATTSWSEAEGDCARTTIRHALYSDLCVLGRTAAGGDLTVTSAIDVIVGCGRPVLIAASKAAEPDFSSVAIAWKESACAARAVTASLPLLAAAKRVHLVCVAEEDGTETATRASAERLAAYLDRHGIKAGIRILRAEGHDPCTTILNAATVEHDAGLLVMGAYGHDRAREFVFGGFTRRVLHTAQLPVLMAH
jgi:nucleotide-binding universal stress UspA family protein